MSSSSLQQDRPRHHHHHLQQQRQHQHHHHDLHNHQHHHSVTRPASLLLAMLVVSALLAPCSSASLLPEFLAEKAKHHTSRQTVNGECDRNMEVSAICYHCASLNTMDFQEVHGACCHAPGPVREICAKWYTTDPKRGGSNTWYY